MGQILETLAGPDEARLPTAQELRLLQSIQISLQTAVISPPSSEALTLLVPIWTYLDSSSLPFPSPDLFSTTWRRFGFQSDDPIRDIRGGGLLSLSFLHYMVKSGGPVVERCRQRRDLALQRDAEKPKTTASDAVVGKFNSYPFACACIGMVRFVSSLLNVCSPFGGAKSPASETGVYYNLLVLDDAEAEAAEAAGEDGKQGFFKLCCLGVEILEDTWEEMKADCYMMFPAVQTKAQETIRSTFLTMAREKARGDGDEWKRHFVRPRLRASM